jgi:hypothetical protein
MLEAYLDESGIHDGALICVISGYFADQGTWRKFEEAWRSMLHDFNVPLKEFHFKDLYPHRRGWFQKHWTGDHLALREAAADIVASHPEISPISVGVIVNDFKYFSDSERRYFTGGTLRETGIVKGAASPNKPYFLPFQLCLIRVCEYAPVDSKAHFFFGIDRLFRGYASELFAQIANSPRRGEGYEWKDRLGMPGYPKAKETPQLQAADMLANLTYHHMLDAEKLLGILAPGLLLEKCISNRRSDYDFIFYKRSNLATALDLAEEMWGTRPIA